MITENPPKLLQDVTKNLRKSPQQCGLSSNYRAIAKKISISLIGGAMVVFGKSAAAQATTFVPTNDGKIGKTDTRHCCLVLMMVKRGDLLAPQTNFTLTTPA